MTFPNDFWMHPKVAPLSVEAKWTFVEMNGYSRMQDLDGVIPVGAAERLWDRETLAELVGSHPKRPLVLRSDDAYVIRDYARHQQTTADREALSFARAEAGRRGAEKRWSEAKRIASAMAKNGNGIAETESETEITTSKEVVARKRASTVPRNMKLTDEMRAWGKENTPLVDLDRKLPEFIDYWHGTGKAMKDWVAVWRNGMRKQQEFAERDRAKAPPTRRVPKNDEWMYR